MHRCMDAYRMLTVSRMGSHYLASVWSEHSSMEVAVIVLYTKKYNLTWKGLVIILLLQKTKRAHKIG